MITKEKHDLHVLFVDDENLIRMLVGEMLERFVEHISICEDGAQGLEFYKNSTRPIDIVISDQTMPNMCGLDMLEAIKKINPKQHCMMITAHSEAQYMLRAIEVGVEFFINKPLKFDKLEDSLNEIARRIAVEKEKEAMDLSATREKVQHAFDFSLESLVSNIPLPSCIIDENDIINICNEDFLTIFSCTTYYQALLERQLDIKTFLQPKPITDDIVMGDWKEEFLMLGSDVVIVSDDITFIPKIKRLISQENKRHYVVCLLEQ